MGNVFFKEKATRENRFSDITPILLGMSQQSQYQITCNK